MSEPTQREKYLKMLQASQEMLDKTANEMDMVKKINPKKDIADKKHIDDIQDQINTQFENEGVRPTKSRAKRVVQEVPQEVVTQNTSTDKYTKDKPYYVNKDENDISSSGLPKRNIPESERLAVEEFEKHLIRNSLVEILPTREMTSNTEFMGNKCLKVSIWVEISFLPTINKIFKIHTLFLKIIPNHEIFSVGRIVNRELELM